MKFKQKFWRIFIVVAICIYALYLRLAALAQHQPWHDELWQLNQMRGSFMGMVKSPRLFSYLSGDSYLLYPFFKLFSYNKWGLVIPHIVSTILGFYILYLICSRYFRTIYGYTITFTLVCFNSTLIHHATEIRPYAVLPTLALASLYLSLQLVQDPARMRRTTRWLIGAFFMLALLFHVYGALILFCPLGFALLTKFNDPAFKMILKNTAKMIAVVLGLTLPIWMLSIFGPHLPWKGHGFKVDDYIPYPWNNPAGFLKDIFGNLVGQKKLYFLLPGMAIPFLLPYKERFLQAAFLLITVFIPIGLIFWVDMTSSYFFAQRQFIWVIPFFAFFLGWAWESLILYLQKK